jgi:hypothetical protein
MPFEDAKTVSELLRGIQQQRYVLPAIQREFVWDGDTQVVRLFDSLMRGYPIGTFLSWAVDAKNASEFKFYGFIRDYHQLKAPHCPLLDVPTDQAVTAILDGQQRLTSLNIGLRGSYARKKKYAWSGTESAYPARRLHLNLLADAPENDLGMVFDFRFFEEPPAPVLTASEADRPQFWYPVSEIFEQKNPIAASKFLLEAGLGAADADATDRLGRLYEVVHNEKLISLYREDDQDIDRVLDIFIRVNSAGKPLSQSDLLLSIATAQFVERDARSAVHSLVDDMNGVGYGFSFDKDLVLKAALALTDAPDFSFKVRNFRRENTEQLDKQWDEVADTLMLTAELLADFGFSSSTLTANSVVIPVAYYVHQRGLGESYRTKGAFDDDRRALRSWVNRTLIKPGVWGSGLDTLLRDLRSVIREHGSDQFPTTQLEASMRRRGKSTEFSPGEVVDLIATSYTQKSCFALLATMFPSVDTRNVFHIDHIFPQKAFSKTSLETAGLSPDEIERAQTRRHRLPNLQLLEGPTNVEKQAAMPRAWALGKYGEAGVADYLARNDLPELTDDLGQFHEFYVERKRRLARRLALVLGVDPDACEELVVSDGIELPVDPIEDERQV